MQYSVNLASRHYAYGSLLTNRTSWVASDWDGVGTESSYRGNLDMPGDFLITPSISSAASNHICGSDPFNEACQFFDGYVETMTFRTSIAPTYTVPAPAGLLSLALGLTGLVTGQWRRQHHA